MVTASVVLVLYNQLGLTRRCLESLRATTGSFELCVVDNGSSDGTEAFFRDTDLPWPVRYRRRDDNAGLIRGLNDGARLATAEVICFLHNDTEMREPRWLERLESGPRPSRGRPRRALRRATPAPRRALRGAHDRPLPRG